MTADQNKSIEAYIRKVTDDVHAARKDGDNRRLLETLAQLGYANFLVSKYEAGTAAFEQADALLDELDDPRLEARYLGKKAEAYQAIKRHHDAYNIVEQILGLAHVHNDDAIRCDALTAQGQILVDSGEPQAAVDKLSEARNLTQRLNDDRRLMQVMGTMGNMNIALMAIDEALVYFEAAAQLASKLEETRTQGGYMLNRGRLLLWQGEPSAALGVLQESLSLAEATDDRAMQLASLQYLAECQNQLEIYEHVPETGLRGLELAAALARPDSEAALHDAVINAYSHMQQHDALRTQLRQAITHAQANDDTSRALELQIKLGEACMLADAPAEAEQAYTEALENANALGRQAQQIMLTGRLGVAKAELGKVDEALPLHQQAAEEARTCALPALEGEQLTMLALAYQEKGDISQAITYCKQALDVYEASGNTEGTAYTRDLLDDLRGSSVIVT